MKVKHILTIVLFLGVMITQAQNERKFVRQGNKYYEKAMSDTSRLDTAQFNKAEIEYRKALEKKPDDSKWNFNLADALYKQRKFEESAGNFKDIADRTTNKIEKSRALHNMGNSLLMNNKLDESIAAFKEALRNNPSDLDTKYNLLYAMNLKKKQEQQKKQNQNKNKNNDKNKDKNKDKDKDKNQDQNQDKQQDQKQDQNKDQKQQQQQNKISKQNAEQMLQALENNEKKTQEKVKKIQALKANSKKVEKDW